MSRTCRWLLVGLLSTMPAAVGLAREWTDNTGQFTVEAELVAVEGRLVKLRKENGRVISVPVARLCEEDQEYLASLDSAPDSGGNAAEPPAGADLEEIDLSAAEMPLTIQAPRGSTVEGSIPFVYVVHEDGFRMMVEPAGESDIPDFRTQFNSDVFKMNEVVSDTDDLIVYDVHSIPFKQDFLVFMVAVEAGDETYLCTNVGDFFDHPLTKKDLELLLYCAGTLKAK